jgi:adenylate cyclase
MVTCFMGDGILAVFGAPKALEQPCSAAYSTAKEILLYVQEFNNGSREVGNTPVEIGIGLHAGEAVVGHVGSTTRYDYSVIGDVTNVASRLESLTKEVGYRLVFSKAVAERLPQGSEAFPLGMNALKGHTPVEAFGYDKV